MQRLAVIRPRINRIIRFVVSALLVAAASGGAAAGQALPARLGTLPATFEGVLPCADCPGIHYHLNLFADGAYYLRTVYQGKPDGTFYDIGSWLESSKGKTLELHGARFATESLKNTYWKLVRLRNEPVIVVENQREAYIVLHAEDRRISGSGGCNRLLGSYRLDGSQIAFGELALTKMACVSGMEQQQGFLDALRSATRWRVLGSHFELLGSDGAVMARLEAGQK